MKQILFLISIFILWTINLFAQTQRSNFEYSSNSYNLNYTFFNNDEFSNFIWYENEIGVFCLDFALKKPHKMYLKDSVSATSLLSLNIDKVGVGTVILRDSVENIYICKVEGIDIKITHTIYNTSSNYNQSSGFLYTHDKDKILFFENNRLFRYQDDKLILLDSLQDPKILLSTKNNWVAANKDSMIYNGLKASVNPYYSKEPFPQMVFYKEVVYAFSNDRVWALSIKNNKIVSDSLKKFNDYIKIFVKDDSLFLEETRTGTFIRNVYYLDNKQFVKKNTVNYYTNFNTITQWQDDILVVDWFPQFDGFLGYVRDKRPQNNGNSKGFGYAKKGSNVYYEFFKQVIKSDSEYVFVSRIGDFSYYSKVVVSKDSISAKYFKLVSKIYEDLVLVNSENVLYLLNLKSLKVAEYFILSLKYNKSQSSQFYLNHFQVYGNNLIYNSQYNILSLIKDFRNNSETQKIDVNYILKKNTDYVVYDTIISLPTISNNIDLLGNKNFYIARGYENNILLLYEVKTKKTIEIISKSTFKRVWVTNDGDLILISNSEILLWKNGSLKILKSNFSTENIDVINIDKFWLIARDTKKTEIYVLENSELVTKFTSKFYYMYQQAIGNNHYWIKRSDNTPLIFNVSGNSFKKIPDFWKGNPNSFWIDRDNTLYAQTSSDNGGLSIYSSINPYDIIVKIPSSNIGIQNGGSSSKNGNIYFWAYLGNKPIILKYSKSDNQLYYINIEEGFSWREVSNTLYFISKKNKQPYYFKIDENGEKQLNTIPINSILSRVYDENAFVFGRIFGGSPQIFELENSIEAKLDWIPIENKKDDTELPKYGQIIAFPNPFLDNITFKFIDVPGITHVGLYDVTGKSVWFDFSPNFVNPYLNKYQSDAYFLLSKTKRENLSEILSEKLSKLSPGVYIVKFYFDEYFWNKSTSVKVLKK